MSKDEEGTTAPSPTATEHQLGWLLVACGAALWGTVGAASKWLYGIADIGPIAVGCLRLALSVPLLAALCLLLRGPRAFIFRGRELAAILGIGVAMALYQVFYFTAVGMAGVAIATLVTICLAPLLVALLSRVVLGERLTRPVQIALVLGLTGTILLVGFPDDVGAEGAIVLAGALWACGSAVSYAVFVLCSRPLARHHGPFELIVVGFGTGAVILLPFALASGMPAAYTGEDIAVLLYIGLVPTALAYVLYFRGMRHTRATPASIITLVEPLTATLLAWAVFDERLGWLGALGGALLLLSLAVLSRARA